MIDAMLLPRIHKLFQNQNSKIKNQKSKMNTAI